jgi:phage terminase large subunit-like protein
MPVRDRMDSMTTIEKLCDLMQERKPVQVAIENVHISKTIGPFLRKRMQERRLYTATWGYTATRDKLARSATLRGRLQQGKIRFHPQFAHIIEEEFIPFPAGRHDDTVDALTVGMLMLDTLMNARPDAAPKPSPNPEWSMAWMKERIAKKEATNTHVPPMINGRARPSKKPPAWTV